MKRLLALALFCLALLPGAPVARVRRVRQYAIVLEDPPVARQIRSRMELQSAQARNHAARIGVAQETLRRRLAGRNIRVLGSVNTLLNAVFVAASEEQLAQLRALPGVRGVVPLHEVRLHLNTAVPLIKAPEAWSALAGAGLPNPGAGVKIAIIDTGIDQNHPAFQDPSLTPPPGFPKCADADCAYTNNKVIVARSYVRYVAQGYTEIPAETSRPDDYSARDRVGHGTAVAMVAAGVPNQAPLAAISGVAPKAYLGSYKVFGSPGINGYSTTSGAILQALDDAFIDGMDIVNLSFGFPAWYGPNDKGAACWEPDPDAPCEVEAQAVETAVSRGVVVVVSAGNDGGGGLKAPTPSTVHAPGTAPSAITAGGTRNAHEIFAGAGLAGTGVPDNLKNLPAAFGDGPQPTAALTAPLRDAGGRACAPLTPGSLAGAIALIQRGACHFVDKVRNARDAGAAGVIIFCDDTQYCVDGGEEPSPPAGLVSTVIPAVLIGRTNGRALRDYLGAHADAQATLDPQLRELADPDVNTVVRFSSRGPSIAPDSALKPEVVAVASHVYTATQRYDPQSELYSPTGYIALDGTSFSASLVAGVAALVKQRNPAFTPAQIKSAIVDTASDSVIVNGGPVVSAAGAGLLDAQAAVRADVTVEPATLALGEVTALVLGSSRTLRITNNSAAQLTLSVEPRETDPDASLRLSTTTVQPNQATSVSATLQGSLPQPGSYSGVIRIHGGAVDLRVPFHYLVGDGVVDNLFAIVDSAPTRVVGDEVLGLVRAVDRVGVSIVGIPVQWTASGGASIETSNDPGVCGPTPVPCLLADTQTWAYGEAAARIHLGSTPGSQQVTATVGTGGSALQFTFEPTAREQPVINDSGVVNGASFVARNGSLPAVAPGSYASIFGAALSDAIMVYDQRLAPGYIYLPLALAEVSVSFDVPSQSISVPGRIHFVSPAQLNVQVPWELQGQTSALMKVRIGPVTSALYTLLLADCAPGIFEDDFYGSGQSWAVAQHWPSYERVGPPNRAQREEWLILYINGLGPVNNQPASGELSPSDPLATARNQVTVTIGGRPAEVNFAGLSPGYIGLYQVNVKVPPDAPLGSQPVVVTVAGSSSKPANVMIQ